MSASIKSVVKRIRASWGLASTSRRVQKNDCSYQQMECKRMLTLLPPPPMTTDVGVFLENTENVFVRIDDDASRLVIRVDGQDNEVDIHLDFGYIDANRTADGPVLAIEPDRYDKILVFGNGADTLHIVGKEVRAQLRPDRTWVSSDSVGQIDGELGPVSVHATDVENVFVEDGPLIDFGPYVYKSDNVIRMYGSDGDDHLTMTSGNPFLITTGATMAGEGYRYRVNSFGSLRVFAGEGDNRASIKGSRDLRATDSLVSIGFYGDGVDQFYAADDFARIRNDRFEAQFSDFDITRVDLLSGDDRVHVVDTQDAQTSYRVDGESLVGNFRRFTNAERITIDGADSANDTLRMGFELPGDFEENGDGGKLRFERTTSGQEEFFPEQTVPANFYWAWRGFEEFIVV